MPSRFTVAARGAPKRRKSSPIAAPGGSAHKRRKSPPIAAKGGTSERHKSPPIAAINGTSKRSDPQPPAIKRGTRTYADPRTNLDQLSDSTLLSIPETAAVLGVSSHTVKSWRAQGRGPKGIKFGRNVRFTVGSLRQLIADSS